MPKISELAAAGISINLHGQMEQRFPCPRCAKGQRDDALCVNVRDGVFVCHRCHWKGRIADSAETWRIPQTVGVDDVADKTRRRKRLQLTWEATVPLEHPKAYAVRRYLQTRALGEILQSPPKVLRAHPGLEYWDGIQSRGRFPAMLAILQSATGDPATLHCTYLRQDGFAKAAVPAAKKILGVLHRGATKGGAVRLFDVRGGILGVAEGIESALSLHLIRGIPVWASFCADNLERLRLPAGLRELQIGVDLDPSGKGEAAANALALRVRRWSPHTRVVFIKPELDGQGDLNDELRRRPK